MPTAATVAAIVAIPCAAFVSLKLLSWARMLASNPPAIRKSGVWHWAAAAPGMNIYVAHSVTRGDGHFVDAWVNRQYFGNIAGIDKNFLDLMQFDCAQKMSRRKSTGRQISAPGNRQQVTTADVGWTSSRAGTSDEGILLVACEHTG